jgi:hypothetical protein
MTPDDWDDGYPDPDDPRWYPPADDDEPGIEALTAAERNPSLIRQGLPSMHSPLMPCTCRHRLMPLPKGCFLMTCRPWHRPLLTWRH